MPQSDSASDGLLIEAYRLNKRFGQVHAVLEVELSVHSGEIFALTGPDGAGKTTLIRLLCGALLPSENAASPPEIRIAAVDMLQDAEQARASIGYLPQRFSLYEDLSVMENIRFFAEARGLPVAEWRPRCLEILAFVGLDSFKDRRAGQLSGGMRQKLGLAAALVHRPKVLLLDEPTTGVDPVTRQDFWQLVIHLVGNSQSAGQGTAVLISTPYMDEAARCTRIGFMRHGRLELIGTPLELCNRLENQIIELAGNPLAHLRQLARRIPGVLDVQMFGDRLHMRVGVEQAEQVIASLQVQIPQEGGVIQRLRIIRPQLEDVFMSLLAGE